VPSNFDRSQRIAASYDLLDLPFEHGRYRRIRRLLFDGLTDRTLDAGVGTGRNFPFYPTSATVVGINISPAMLARADARRQLAAAEVELRVMDVSQLDFPSDSFDAAVATFLFCVLPNAQQVPALRELGRVVQPGALSGFSGIRPSARDFSAHHGPALGAVDRVGVWGEFRSADRGACSGHGSRTLRGPLCGPRSDQTDIGAPDSPCPSRLKRRAELSQRAAIRADPRRTPSPGQRTPRFRGG
jgi:SAM-dependent methyltransferase